MAINLGYDSQKFIQGSKNFLTSNSLVARIVFIILVIIVFIILLRLGTSVLSFLFTPSPNPMLINGMKDAKKLLRIPQDPKKSEHISILRSNDQFNGLEFTWSVWILIDDPGYEQYRYKHVFHKGNSAMNGDGIVEPNNGPGLYISPVNYPNMSELSLLVRMNVFTDESSSKNLTQLNQACLNAVNAQKAAPNHNPASDQETIDMCNKTYPLLKAPKDEAIAPAIYDDIEIPDIPVNKWVNVIIRCSYNNILDIYINERLVKRHKLSGVAHQNYGDVFVNLNGGFSGLVSCLKYYNYAIGTGEISSIVSSGPCLKPIGGDVEHSKPYYLANQWFFNETDDLYSPSLNK